MAALLSGDLPPLLITCSSSCCAWARERKRAEPKNTTVSCTRSWRKRAWGSMYSETMRSSRPLGLCRKAVFSYARGAMGPAGMSLECLAISVLLVVAQRLPDPQPDVEESQAADRAAHRRVLGDGAQCARAGQQRVLRPDAGPGQGHP